jgi:hypothetical protein
VFKFGVLGEVYFPHIAFAEGAKNFIVAYD